jgi:phosphomannomutase/phosphoglucomutase
MNNISDSILKEYDIRGKFPEQLSADDAFRLGWGYATEYKMRKVVVGRDMRSESAAILPAFCRGMACAGVKIYDLDIVSTPEVFFAVGHHKYDGGVMATASHNPTGYTGLKLIDRQGRGIGRQTGLLKIAKRANACPVKDVGVVAKSQSVTVYDAYYKFISRVVDIRKFVGQKVILDGRHGSVTTATEYIFGRLPLQYAGINMKPARKQLPFGFNPLLSVNHRQLKSAVKKQKASLGIMWDGDGDRCVFFDEHGQFIAPYYMNCLLSQIITSKKKKPTIAIDARLPQGLSQVIKAHGGRPYIVRSGWSNFGRVMLKKNIMFGCENSAHYFIDMRLGGGRSQYVFSDALLTPLLVMEYLGVQKLTLSEAVAPFKNSLHISGELNFEDVDSKKLFAKIKRRYKLLRMQEVDGLSVFGKDWFFNVRASNTEPLVRINIEAKSPERVIEIKEKLLSLM